MTEQKLKDVLWNYACNTGYMTWLGVSMREYVNDNKAEDGLDDQELERHQNHMVSKYDEPGFPIGELLDFEWTDIVRDREVHEVYQF